MDNSTHEIRRLKNKTRYFRIAMSIILLFFVSTSVFVYKYIDNSFKNVQGEDLNKEDVGITDDTKKIIKSYDNNTKNILLLGIDEPDKAGDPQRSDSIMIFTIDTKNKTLKLSSLMRDTLVNIDGVGRDKLNHAFAYGGVQLSVKTVNTAFDMDITDYILVNYHNLIQIIDAIGGIDIEVTEAEVPLLNEAILDINRKEFSSVEDITTPGLHHMNGTQATAYSRIRRAGPNDTDYNRARRQRLVIWKMFEKLKTTPVIKLPQTVTALSSFVKTSMSTDEMIQLSSQILLDGITTMKEARFPSVNTSEEMDTPELWYLKYNKKATVKELHDFVFLNISPDVPSDNPETAPPTENKKSTIPDDTGTYNDPKTDDTESPDYGTTTNTNTNTDESGFIEAP